MVLMAADSPSHLRDSPLGREPLGSFSLRFPQKKPFPPPVSLFPFSRSAMRFPDYKKRNSLGVPLCFLFAYSAAGSVSAVVSPSADASVSPSVVSAVVSPSVVSPSVVSAVVSAVVSGFATFEPLK